jgi:hypothetical protein
MPKIEGSFEISHSNRLILIGSCFTENIGDRLKRAKFSCLQNPFGIVFNPVSVAITLNRILENRLYQEADLVEINGLWHSWDHHGSFSGTDKKEVLNKINQSLAEARLFLEKTDTLLVSLGTAWAFRKQSDQAFVANCHKAPANTFTRERLSTQFIIRNLEEVLKKIKTFRPELRVVLTVSPVRHLRDGFIENQRSKASLLLSCEALEQQFDRVQYFPSYELLLDDLRDYRFFTEDMTHPSQEAINYIWDAFQNSYFSPSTKAKIVQIEKIKQAIEHRPFHPESEQHQKFVRDTLNKLQLLHAENPNIDFSSEIDKISSQ